MKLSLVVALLLVAPCSLRADERLPIIDMHLHARKANFAGPNPPPMCAPFVVMPRSDPAKSVRDLVFNVDPPCEHPIPAATTDEQVMRDTIAVMEKHNIIGMVSGEPELMKMWRAAAPQRIIPGIDLRLTGAGASSHVAVRSVKELRALHSRGAFQVLGEVLAQMKAPCRRSAIGAILGIGRGAGHSGGHPYRTG